VLDECPIELVTPEAWEAIGAVEAARTMRMALVAGGMEDQPMWFIRATELVERDRRGYLMKQAGPMAATALMFGVL
jgi:hypothetical protein